MGGPPRPPGAGRAGAEAEGGHLPPDLQLEAECPRDQGQQQHLALLRREAAQEVGRVNMLLQGSKQLSYCRDGSVISSYEEDILISVVSLDGSKSLEEPNTFLMYLAIIGFPATLVLLIGEARLFIFLIISPHFLFSFIPLPFNCQNSQKKAKFKTSFHEETQINQK